MSTPYSLPVRVYYEDTDFSGVVYHANYLKFFERARTEALRLIGLSHRSLIEADEPRALSVRSMEVEFIRPARIDDALDIVTEVADLKGARVVFRQTAKRGEEIIASALVTVACMTPDGKPRRLPPAMVKALMG